MSEHTVDELKRQLVQALSRRREAEKAHREAELRLHQKVADESGLIGKIATYRGRSLKISHLTFWSHGDGTSIRNYVGPRILKGGELGQQIDFHVGSSVQIQDAPPSEPQQEHRNTNDA